MHAFDGGLFTISIHAFEDLHYIFQWSKKIKITFLLLNMKPSLLKWIFCLETDVSNN